MTDQLRRRHSQISPPAAGEELQQNHRSTATASSLSCSQAVDHQRVPRSYLLVGRCAPGGWSLDAQSLPQSFLPAAAYSH